MHIRPQSPDRGDALASCCLSPGNVCSSHTADRIDRHRGEPDKSAKFLPAERRRARVTRRYLDRTEDSKIGAQRAGSLQFSGVVAGRRDQQGV